MTHLTHKTCVLMRKCYVTNKEINSLFTVSQNANMTATCSREDGGMRKMIKEETPKAKERRKLEEYRGNILTLDK